MADADKQRLRRDPDITTRMRLLRERMRAAEVTEEQLQIALYLGHPDPAAKALVVQQAADLPDSQTSSQEIERWLTGFPGGLSVHQWILLITGRIVAEKAAVHKRLLSRRIIPADHGDRRQWPVTVPDPNEFLDELERVLRTPVTIERDEKWLIFYYRELHEEYYVEETGDGVIYTEGFSGSEEDREISAFFTVMRAIPLSISKRTTQSRLFKISAGAALLKAAFLVPRFFPILRERLLAHFLPRDF